MFTSRAEYRILLRQDNADERLTPMAHDLGLASDERMQAFEKKLDGVSLLRKGLQKLSIPPADALPALEEAQSSPLKHAVRAQEILSRPHMHLDRMQEHIPSVHHVCAPHGP